MVTAMKTEVTQGGIKAKEVWRIEQCRGGVSQGGIKAEEVRIGQCRGT